MASIHDNPEFTVKSRLSKILSVYQMYGHAEYEPQVVKQTMELIHEFYQLKEQYRTKE